MKNSRRIILVSALCVILLVVYYRFGYPLRNTIESSTLLNSCLATQSISPHDVFFPSERKLSGRPYLNCRASIVVDNETNEIIYSRNADTPRSVASITKLLSALVLCDMDFDWTKVIQVTREDARNSARSHLKIGEKLYASDLFYIALISSDNRAMRAIVRECGVPLDEFIDLMNQKAREIGMYDSEFYEVTGLDEHNVSTAEDCVRLLHTALKQDLIKDALTTYRYQYRSLNHKRRRNIVNTNRLLLSKWKIAGGKTGYIVESGYCLATRMSDSEGHDITVVVLGAPFSGTRFSVTRKISSWAFRNLSRFDSIADNQSVAVNKP